MRILITGGEGQLGRALKAALLDHVVVALTHAEMDVTNGTDVLYRILGHEPDVVINCAALTDTARCEREPDMAHRINATGAANIARTCEQTERSDERYLTISTNEVFDGTKGTPYVEDDEPRAVNAYGRSKLEGERLALAAEPTATIVRTSWLYGDGGNNFVQKVCTAARAGRPLRFVTDEIAAPTSSADLAVAIRELIERGAPAGIYHLTNEGEASRYEWADEILRLDGMSDVPLEPVTTTELRTSGYEGPAKPPYSVLANTRAAALGIRLRPWREALAAYFERARVAADG